jgi:hypothetical protein
MRERSVITQWFSELSDYKMTQQARVCKPARRCAHGSDGGWVIKLYFNACHSWQSESSEWIQTLPLDNEISVVPFDHSISSTWFDYS